MKPFSPFSFFKINPLKKNQASHYTTRLSQAVFLSLFCWMFASSMNPVHAQAMAAGGDMNLSSQSLTSGVAGRDMLLNEVTVNGALSAGRNIECQNCSLSGKISAGRDIHLDHCNTVQSDLVSGNNISLNNLTLERNAVAGNQIQTQNATIEGRLTLGGDTLKLDHSKANDIYFQGSHNSYESRIGNTVIGNGIIGNGIMVSSHDTIQGSGSFVHVGPGSLSSVNGYTIKGAESQTTVITPGQTIYVNGRKVSGSGPKGYAEYRTEHPEAPVIRGPGWSEDQEAFESTSKGTHTTVHASSKTVVNHVDLVNHSIVNGQIVFENGYGKVRVYPGSQFNGHVVNGTVEKVKEALN